MLLCVRTTLTFDPDVAAQIERLRSSEGRPFKQLVNDLLRAGLAVHAVPAERRGGPFTRVVSLGKPLLPDVDDISEVLALIEGEDHR
jgi:hypothetical protein